MGRVRLLWLASGDRGRLTGMKPLAYFLAGLVAGILLTLAVLSLACPGGDGDPVPAAIQCPEAPPVAAPAPPAAPAPAPEEPPSVDGAGL